jgi:hypothetical protein
MHSAAASGYIVLASAFTLHLPVGLRERYTDAIAAGDVEEVAEILHANAPAGFPLVDTPFVFQDEWESDTLVRGEMYFAFSLEDLYVVSPKPELRALHKCQIHPVFDRWVTFG